jgi:hypothetical protein
MADTQTQLYVTDFSNQLNTESQQITSKTRGKILERPVTGDYFDYYTIGGLNANKVTGRFAPRSSANPDLERRGVIAESWEQTLYYSGLDQLRSRVNVNSGYAKTLMAGMGREYDRTVYNALTGSVKTGKLFENTVTASADGVGTVTASSGLTYDKVLETIANFKSKDIDEKIYFAITDKQWATLMSEVEAISSDYNKKMAAETGILPGILGAEFIVFGSNPTTGSSIIPVSGGVRACVAFAQSGVHLGVLSDIQVKQSDRPDLEGDTSQLVVSSTFAALRTEGAKVQLINVTE